MKKTITIILSLFFTIILTSAGYSQETGSFNKTIVFMGENRTISFYVPTDYNAENQYRLMVCLHGLGDNSTNFRNALISARNWNNLMPDMIFACPDGGDDRSRDFYAPEGDEELIAETINWVEQNYNINMEKIYLEGFSLGGRSALKYGLDNPDVFAGLMLNTPAAQGHLDAMNDPNAGLIYNYANAPKIPIAIIHGTEDMAYINPDMIIYEKLIENNGPVKRYFVQDMGHNIPGSNVTNDAMDFLDNPIRNQYDIHLFYIETPERTCSPTTKAICKIRNIGSDTIKTITFSYSLNGDEQEYSWTGELSSFDYTEIELPEMTLEEGNNDLNVDISSLNSDIQDEVPDNNNDNAVINLYNTGISLPLSEGFEGESYPPDDWVLNQSGALFTWLPDNETKKDGQYSIFSFNTILFFYTLGSREEIMTPVLDLSTIEKPAIKFDMAYNYYKYTPPYFNQDTEFTDTLEISISTDCGETFEVIYKKYGHELATADEPITNVLNLQDAFFEPTNAQWRWEQIKLGDYADAANAVIKFTYISGQGGNIYVDNIKVEEESANSVKAQPVIADVFSIYPNPASSKTQLSVQPAKTSEIQISIYDLNGNEVRRIHNGLLSNEQYKFFIKTEQLSSGSYFIRLSSAEGTATRKLLID